LIKKDEVGWTCSTHLEMRNLYIKSKNLKGRDTQNIYALLERCFKFIYVIHYMEYWRALVKTVMKITVFLRGTRGSVVG
jgi:hypothetical protein